MFKHLQTIYIGDALFRDQLAIGFILVILTNGLLLLCTALYSKFYDHVKSYSWGQGKDWKKVDSVNFCIYNDIAKR